MSDNTTQSHSAFGLVTTSIRFLNAIKETCGDETYEETVEALKGTLGTEWFEQLLLHKLAVGDIKPRVSDLVIITGVCPNLEVAAKAIWLISGHDYERSEEIAKVISCGTPRAVEIDPEAFSDSPDYLDKADSVLRNSGLKYYYV